jgi:hypothetical protein
MAEKHGVVAPNETLVSIYSDPDPLFGPVAAWEIGRRLQKVKSTSLATRFLLPRDETDHADAFDGLTATCWRAKGNLYIRPDEDRTYYLHHTGKKDGFYANENVYAATRKFIILTVLEILTAYREKTPIEILTAALSGKFRYVPRQVKNRMVDAIREWTAAKCHAVLLDFDYILGQDEDGEDVTNDDTLPARDDASSVLGRIAPRAWHYTPEELNGLFQADRNAWVNLAGERGWEVIFAAVDLYGRDGADGTERDWDKHLTQKIAYRRGVSFEQARADRRKLQETLRPRVIRRHRLVEKLWELFTPPADWHRNIRSGK